MSYDIIKTLQDHKALPASLEAIQEAAQQKEMSVEQYVLTSGVVSQLAIAKAYGAMFAISVIEVITESMADPVLLAKFQFNFLRHHMVMPLQLEDKIVVVMANPFKVELLDEMRFMLGKQCGQMVAPAGVIAEAINRFYPLEGAKQMMNELEEEDQLADSDLDIGAIDEQDILTVSAQAPIVKLVNHILFQAVKRDASDIHIEPFEKEVRVRYRVDGVMYLALTPPKRIQSALISRLKIMANLNIAEKRLPQDGRIEIKVADKAFDIRVSVLPVAYGERVVMRMLDKGKASTSLTKLGLSTHNLKIVESIITQPNGIILVSGPTGSGKTTTLYAVLSKLNQPDVNIVTVEDPVEYQIAGVNQVQVKDKIGLSFAAALRSILRQDPDIVMIGETRDAQTAQIAIQAALTGHLVLSTIHTNNAPATITRLIDMGIEPFLISSSVHAVVAQRLVRKLCQVCAQSYKPTSEQLQALGIDKKKADSMTFSTAVGCEACMNSGYKGRLAIVEIMVMSNKIARLVVARADANEIRKQAIADGMHLLIQDGIDKIGQGLTTIEEVLMVATNQETMD